MTSYERAVKDFKPQFGNANHIAAVQLIARRNALDVTLKKAEAAKRKPSKAGLNEMDQLERRITDLLRPDAPMSTYPPSFPQ